MMKFSSVNSRDIEKYFHGTWVKFPVDLEAGHTDPDTLVLIDRVTKQMVSGTDEKGQRYVVYLSEDPELSYDFEYILPIKSYFSYKGEACLLSRVPARQWKKGISSENTQILLLTRYGNFNKLNLTSELLAAYTKKESFGTLDDVAKGRSVPLARRFAAAPDGRIFLDSTRIARMDAHQRAVFTKHRIFVGELTEIAKKCGYSVHVVTDEDSKVVKKIEEPALEF